MSLKSVPSDRPTIGGPGDTIDDRHNNTPALRFEDEGGGLVYLVRANGTRYAFAGRSDLPGWLDYYRRMADALDRYLYPLPPEDTTSAETEDEVAVVESVVEDEVEAVEEDRSEDETSDEPAPEEPF